MCPMPDTASTRQRPTMDELKERIARGPTCVGCGQRLDDNIGSAVDGVIVARVCLNCGRHAPPRSEP